MCQYWWNLLPEMCLVKACCFETCFIKTQNIKKNASNLLERASVSPLPPEVFFWLDE